VSAIPERGPTVGVLALQGDYAAHERALQRSGCGVRRVRRPADLAGLDGLVLPGGESSTLLRLLDLQRLTEPLGAVLRSGLPVLATCAGLILCARGVVDPPQPSFGVLDVDVARNAYGRQIRSGTVPLRTSGGELPPEIDGVFIRAPRIVRVGARCAVLARRGGDPVLVREGAVLGACFHPELQPGHPVTALFTALVHGRRPASRTA